MVVRAANAESELIDALCERVGEHVPDDQAVSCEAFLRQYYQWVPHDDLTAREPDDLLGAALAHWELAQERSPGEANLRVYNPDRDKDGWGSSHTVIEYVTEDMPFLVDSVTMACGALGYSIALVIHPVMGVRRDAQGRLLEVPEHDRDAPDALSESIMHVEVTREPDRSSQERLRENLTHVLDEVRVAVEDWEKMRSRAEDLADEMEDEEAALFLRWMAEDHFTFLGFREYELTTEQDELRLTPMPDTGLGILRRQPKTPYKTLEGAGRELATAPSPLVLTKANSRSRVHRPAYLDYIGVKRFDEAGRVTGERRFLGLYTSAAYRASPLEIPLLRGKVKAVLKRAEFPPASHDAKALLEILESYPRDSLIQVEDDELFHAAMGLLGLGERPRVRLFVRRESLGRYVSCLVTIPRDRYNTENRERVGEILLKAFRGSQLDWTPHLSESVLARVHYVVHCENGIPDDYDAQEIEQELACAVRAWSDDLRGALFEDFEEEHAAALYRRYQHAFPPAYRSDWEPRDALQDIDRLERLDGTGVPIISLYEPGEEQALRCKLFSAEEIALSSVLPTFEHMGAQVVDERPYAVSPADRDPVWVYDFGLRCVADDSDEMRERFEETFLGVWRGELEDDRLNGLVLRAGLPGREIAILRAIAKYLRQARLAYSDAYVERTLLAHPEIARLLVQLFMARFDPDRSDEGEADRLADELTKAIDEVQSLDEDRILRALQSVLAGALRTSYFREGGGDDDAPSYFSLKLDPSEISVLPRPRPQFEIFVYSPRFEGVHLRGGKVARGGLRWSDRPEDFRTEVLGLMKAQMVKNALIVPVGSKGGFVLKRAPAEPEQLQEEAIACYRAFLSGMLDLTDNVAGGEVTGPERVVRYDGDDPYLVVAADKGTASFSDIANEVSERYGFWLGDAFASGGSHGYDHKQMGITARGAWESVKRHFRELGIDTQSEEFTVVGIGDMSGDVFGNGMLLSEHLRLLAAFNHTHVFIDPDPDPKASYAERKRLFELGRSWSDYDESKISKGGGVFKRTEKSIRLSKAAREALGIDAQELAPPELINAILRAPVDLLFNGGIGTYVKASHESQADAGDKANDLVRANAAELRCRVVGEGGNLGFTQRGRIEFALSGGPDQEGGRINTDAIDNVGGVNCSDHEVNIKILLDSLVDKGELGMEERNDLLVQMTDSVSEQVVYGSYTQTQAMSLALAQAAPMIDVHARMIRHLEQVAGLDRELEFLPSEEAIDERRNAHRGLVAPELSVVMAYCKIHLYSRLIDSDLPSDEHLAHDLEHYFPAPLPELYSEQMREHRLRREIVATMVANQLVDRAGTTFVFRLAEETSASASTLARAFAVARDTFAMRSFWSEVEGLDNQVEAQTQLAMLIEGRRLVERATRWLVRANRDQIDIGQATRYFRPGAELLARALPDVLDERDREAFAERAAELQERGVPRELSERVAGMSSMLSVFDIVEVASATGREPEDVMTTYFRLGWEIELGWLRDRIIELPRTNRWQALARAALRDDLTTLHRALTREVLEAADGDSDPPAAIESWKERHRSQLERCLRMIRDIRASETYDTTTLPVALREVRNLVSAGGGVAGAESQTDAG